MIYGERQTVVTGAAAGIGKASAMMLARSGASVALLDRNYDAAALSASEIASECGVQTKAYRCDVLAELDSEAVIEEAARDFGVINILVNNAGGGGGGREIFDGLTDDYLNKIFGLNVYSIFRFSRLCLPHMKRAGYGSIINISSMASVMSSVNMSVYSALKGGRQCADAPDGDRRRPGPRECRRPRRGQEPRRWLRCSLRKWNAGCWPRRR